MAPGTVHAITLVGTAPRRLAFRSWRGEHPRIQSHYVSSHLLVLFKVDDSESAKDGRNEEGDEEGDDWHLML